MLNGIQSALMGLFGFQRNLMKIRSMQSNMRQQFQCLLIGQRGILCVPTVRNKSLRIMFKLTLICAKLRVFLAAAAILKGAR